MLRNDAAIYIKLKTKLTKEHQKLPDPEAESQNGAGAVTAKRLGLEQNGPQIWGRLWLSFGQEQDRGVDVRGEAQGESTTPRGDYIKTSISRKRNIVKSRAVYQTKALNARNESTSFVYLNMQMRFQAYIIERKGNQDSKGFATVTL